MSTNIVSARKILVSQDNTFVGSGADFGAVPTGGFARLTGLASAIGSMTIRMRSAIDPTGPFLVSSNWSVNSGITYLDVFNYGAQTYFDVTATVSQQCSFIIYGEPTR